MSMYVCLTVCLYVCVSARDYISGTTRAVIYQRSFSSVVLWWRCDAFMCRTPRYGHCIVVRKLTPLLHRTGCVVS